MRTIRTPRAIALIAGAVIAATLTPASVALADGDVGHIYLYNGTRADVYDRAAKGWCFEQACLLGPNGEFPQVEGDNLRVDTDGDGKSDQTTGTVIRDDDNNIIGYQSADEKKRVYDLDTSATFLRAWNEIDPNGEIIVAKHGALIGLGKDEADGTGIYLDGGTLYLGFKEGEEGDGTVDGGVVGVDPYCLPPRKGAMIDLWLNSCYSDDDPDGDDDGRSSVSDTAEGVTGVDNVRGNEGCIRKCLNEWNVTCFPDQETADAAAEAFRACAATNGFTRRVSPDSEETIGHVGAWLETLDPADMEQALRDCLGNAEPPIEDEGLKITFSWGKGDDCNAEGGGTGAFTPATPARPDGTVMFYIPGSDITRTAAMAVLPPLPEPIPFIMYPQPADIAELPFPDLAPVMPAMTLEPYFPLNGPPLPPLPEPFFMELRFSTFGFEPDSFEVFILPPRSELWQPFPAEFEFDTILGSAFIQGDFQSAAGPFLVVGIPLFDKPECPTDFDGNGAVNAADVGAFISQYFVDLADGTLVTDFDNNGVVNAADVGAFLSQYFEDLVNPDCNP